LEILEQLKGTNGKKISGYIERAVRLLHEQATLAEDLKALGEDVKTEFDIKPAEFSKVAKAAFDTEMLAKKQAELEQVAQAVDVHKTLS
jgi:uncharacterized protein (UPF0335 family)